MQIDKELITKTLQSELCYIYCDNCRYEQEDEPCDMCHRKSMHWEASKEHCESITGKIESIMKAAIEKE